MGSGGAGGVPVQRLVSPILHYQHSHFHLLIMLGKGFPLDKRLWMSVWCRAECAINDAHEVNRKDIKWQVSLSGLLVWGS